VTAAEAIEISRRDLDPEGKFECGEYRCVERLGYWQVEVGTTVDPHMRTATYEIDGETGVVLSRLVYDL
jgi:hypothetical protein